MNAIAKSRRAPAEQMLDGVTNGRFVIDHENAVCTALHLTALERGIIRPVVVKSDRRHHAT
jgi:hypothetical protein